MIVVSRAYVKYESQILSYLLLCKALVGLSLFRPKYVEGL